MVLNVVAIRDVKMNAFSRPWFVPTIGVAVRSFGDECKRDAADNPMWSHPEDFELFHIGMFDEETGKLESLVSPKQLALATQYREVK